MPIVVIAMEQDDYNAWVESQKAGAEVEKQQADKEWTTDELMDKGESVYTNNCASCHMADGAGMEGTFPALTGSSVVTGDIDAQIELMYNGKGMMPAFGQMLSETEFASVVTYTRNALGNSVGDSVQPAAIKSLKSSAPADEEEDEDDEE